MGKIGFLLFMVSIFISLGSAAEQKALDLNKQEKQYLQNVEILTVSNEMDWAPFDYVKDGKPAGYSIGLMELVSERIGVEFEYVNGLRWDQLLKRFRQKEIDIMSAINYTDERTSYALFTKPYFQNNIAVFANPHSNIRSLGDLTGKKVALPRQYSILDTLNKQVDNLIHIPVANTKDAIKAVSSGRADFTVESASMVQHKIASMGIDNVRIRFFPEFEYGENKDIHLRSAVHKEEPVLFSILQKALDSITKEEKTALKQKWQPSSMNIASPQSQGDFSSMLTQKQKVYIQNKERLKFCAAPNWMPYEAIDEKNTHKGMAADIAKVLSNKLGVDFELVKTKDWSQSLAYLKQRKCDLTFMSQDTTDRREYLDFTTPYYTFPFVIATKTDTLFIDDISDHMDKTYGIVRDYSTEFKLRQSYPMIDLKNYSGIQQGLKALQKGKIDGFIDTTNTIGYVINAQSLTNLKIGGRIPLYYRISMATRSDDKMLGQVMQKAVDSLSSKERDRIYNRWVAVVQQKQYDYSLLWKVLLAVTAIIAAVLYSNSRLRKAKNETAQTMKELQKTQEELKESNEELRNAAITDHLTGLHNRMQLDTIFQKEFSRAERYDRVFGIILLDLDDFKQINDTKGHQVGDEVLKETANLLREHCRESDSIGRWGGEEFLIICPETDKQGTLNAARHLCDKLDKFCFRYVSGQTASFGVSVYQPGHTIVELMAKVDKALYKAKEEGKNRVVFD